MKKILFIEDAPDFQKEIGEALKLEEFKILAALDGEAGLELIKKEKPDLILLDLILPKKDGFTVLKEIKEDENLKDIPVIVLTNLEGMGDVEKAMSLGATTYLVKANYELDDVVTKIKKTLKE